MRLETLSLIIGQSGEGKDASDHGDKDRASIDGTPSAPEARTGIDLWEGVEWQGAFLAIDRPDVLRLQKIEDQHFQQSAVTALEAAGFRCHLAALNNLSPALDAGRRIVWATDRQSYRARLTQNNELVLVAKRNA